MSRADDTYDPLELASIKSKMNILFSEDTDLEKKLYLTIREYNSFDKTKLMDLFTNSIKHFNEKSSVSSKVFKDLSEIIEADGKVDQSETNALEALKRIIDNHAKNGW